MKKFTITRYNFGRNGRSTARPIVVSEASTTTTPGEGRTSIRLIGYDHDENYRKYAIDLSPDLVKLIAKVHAQNEERS